ncbi:MAG: hypothetical protein LQ343_007869 [Gyalolechia ehrenbergii]|nr:MAG: hypothetical protein LQ343_007869 [Gyalolechia ehrenbergii]
MPPSKPAYDIDWILSPNSNVHVANHRDWFLSYEPFVTTLDTGVGGSNIAPEVQVLGIGNVELPTKTHPTRTGAAYQGTILLREVLYAPGALCNILGFPMFDDYGYVLDCGAETSKITAKQTGAVIGLLDRNKLFRLRLKGQSAKQSSLDPDSHYIIRANWSSSERESWAVFRTGRDQQAPAASTAMGNGSTRLTDSEKSWLKVKYGGEFKFLRDYGLSIYKDEDRDEGRCILRALMEEESEDDNDSLDSFQRDLETDPSSHFADHYFSDDELDWIKANFGHSANFLLAYGLKFYNDEDCQEGKSIIRALMEDGDEA